MKNLKVSIFLFYFLIICLFDSYSQKSCGTDELYYETLQGHPELSEKYGRSKELSPNQQEVLINTRDSILRVPVVVHVIWNSESEKLNSELIKKQIEVLNDDFRGRNKDRHKIPSEFLGITSKDSKIEFFLTDIAPDGSDTNGITWTKTNENRFYINLKKSQNEVLNEQREGIKFSSYGGCNAWPSAKYLNIWVGNISKSNGGPLLGYASFPTGFNKFDGVVINYKHFGANISINQGRTLTHEVGHWLNLNHIWGDKILIKTPSGQYVYRYSCDADDGIYDTPRQFKDYSNCKSLSQKSCGCHDLVVNYMDYVDDTCMVMFSEGQTLEMRTTILFLRAGILSNKKNESLIATNTQRLKAPQILSFDKYWKCNNPNDTCKYAYISWTPVESAITYKVMCKKVKSKTWKVIEANSPYAKIGGLNSGISYEIKIVPIFPKENLGLESSPYIFRLKGMNPFKFKTIKIRNIDNSINQN